MSYAPRYASPLSSPSLSASGSSSAGSFPAPSVAMSASSSASSYGTNFQRTTLGPSSSARRSSSPCFPRSQPLRPLSSGLCMSSLNAPALRRKSEGAAEPRPINYMMQPSRGNGKKVKMLVSSKNMVRPLSTLRMNQSSALSQILLALELLRAQPLRPRTCPGRVTLYITA